MPQMHLFVGDKLKSTAQQAHSGKEFNDADANSVDFHQVERGENNGSTRYRHPASESGI